MDDTGTVHNTFVVERELPKPPAKVFEAFARPEKKQRWYAESRGHDVVRYELDFRVGGRERLDVRMNDKTPFPGVALSYDMEIADIVPERRIVFSQSMDFGGRRVSVALITLEFVERGAGATLTCTHQGAFFEGADGPQIREQGWRALFDRLAESLG